MSEYRCRPCSYIYDPRKGQLSTGVKSNTPWEDVPDDWRCPICGAPKDAFEKLPND